MKRILITGFVFMLMIAFGDEVYADNWENDFSKALEKAAKSGNYMLLDFSGSDWCGWCMKLDKEVFKKSEFKTFAKNNLVCVLIDFPQQKPQTKKEREQNEALASKYGVRGFPTVLILSPKGELVARTGYMEGGAKKYVAYLREIIEKHKNK